MKNLKRRDFLKMIGVAVIAPITLVKGKEAVLLDSSNPLSDAEWKGFFTKMKEALETANISLENNRVCNPTLYCNCEYCSEGSNLKP